MQVMSKITAKRKAGYIIVLFGAIPCTPWTRWQDLNIHQYGPEFEEKLLRQRVENLLMVKNFFEVAKLVQEDPRSKVAYEWPAHCRGWENPTVERIMKSLNLQELRIDGCQLGVQTPDGKPILKPWKIMTDSEGLRQALWDKRCPRDHQHEQCAGSYTEKTGYYPAKMAKAIIKGFMDDLLNQVSR
jgi:hypothetical protein